MSQYACVCMCKNINNNCKSTIFFPLNTFVFSSDLIKSQYAEKYSHCHKAHLMKVIKYEYHHKALLLHQ